MLTLFRTVNLKDPEKRLARTKKRMRTSRRVHQMNQMKKLIDVIATTL